MQRPMGPLRGPKHGTTAWPQTWDLTNTPSMGGGHCVVSDECFIFIIFVLVLLMFFNFYFMFDFYFVAPNMCHL